MHYHRRRFARLRQPHPRIPGPLVEVLAVFPWAAIRVARIRFNDGDQREVEATLLGPPGP